MTQQPQTSLGDATVTGKRARGRGIVRRLLRGIAWGLFGLILAGMIGWAALAVYFADTHSGPRTIRALLLVAACLAAIVFIRPRRTGLAAFAAIFVAVLIWFFSLSPSNERDWAPEIALISWGKIEGDLLTVHNVRNFEYRSETDFTPKWEDRTYDLSRLRTFDFMLVYWGSPSIAHAMVSFGFDDGKYLAVSIETRKEKSESFSTVQGFFRQYEMSYIFADERDVVYLRTEHRKEDVYLYRTNATPAEARAILTSYVARANSLKDHPEFYNALTSNCATSVVTQVQEAGVPAKMSWEILLSGYAARRAYENGRLDTSLPFEELQRRSHINGVAHSAGNDADFSRMIRAGLPSSGIRPGTSTAPAPAAQQPR